MKKNSIKLVCGIVLLLSCSNNLMAQCDPALAPDSVQFWFDQPPTNTYQDGSRLYVGGSFTYIGKQTGAFAGVDTATGNILNVGSWPQVSGVGQTGGNCGVYAAIQDGSGGWIIGGAFSQVGSASRHNLARIDASGNVTSWNPNPINLAYLGNSGNGEVHSLAIHGDTLYVGGYFDTIANVPRSFLAAFQLSTGNILPWSPNIHNNNQYGSGIHTFAMNANTLYAGGCFDSVSGQRRGLVAAFDIASGSLKPFNAYIDTASNGYGCVYAMQLSGAKLYFGGLFYYVGNTARNNIACVDTSGILSSWNPNANTYVYALWVNGTTSVFAGGSFSNIGGQTRYAFAELNQTNGLATATNINLAATVSVYSFNVAGNNLYIGGNLNNSSMPGLTAINYTNGSPVNVNTFPFADQGYTYDYGSVYTINPVGSNLYLGGILNVMAEKRSGVAAFDMNTASLSSWNPHITPYSFSGVNSICTNSNTVFLGGGFSKEIAAVDKISGQAIASFNDSITGSVYHIAVNGSKLFIDGDMNKITVSGFTTSFSSALSCIAIDNTSGAYLPAWAPGISISATVNAMIPYQNGILFGGTFSAVGSQTRNNIAMVDTSTGATTSWNPNADNTVNTLVANGNTIYTGGSFNNIGGQFVPKLAKLYGGSNSASTWQPYADNAVKAIALSSGQAIVGGTFANMYAATHNLLAIVDTSSGAPTSWAPNPGHQYLSTSNPSISTLNVYGNKLFVGGWFQKISNDSVMKHFAIYTIQNAPALITISGASTLCAGATANFSTTISNGGTAPTYQWKKNGTNIPGATASTYSSNSLSNGDVITCTLTSNAACVPVNTVSSNAITMTISPVVTPTLSIAGSNTVCAGTNVTYTATSNVAGVTYQWQVNGSNVGTNTNTYSYAPVNSDAVKCICTMPAGCYSASADTSNVITMTVNANTTPTLSASAGSNPVCAGTSVTYTATSNVSGVTYQWKVNGSNVGTNSSTYSYVPVNSDVIKCIATMPAGCYTASADSSSPITMTVNPNTTPSLSISGSANPVCAGTSVTYTATNNIAGATFQWFVNNSAVGTSTSTYSYTPANSDHVKCVITVPAGGCYTSNTDTSNVISMTVNNNVVPTITISPSANNVCAGTPVTFTATTNVTGGSYQWQVNSANVGANSSSYSYTPANADQVICSITTPSTGCFSPTSATSSSVTMNIMADTTPSITLSGPSIAIQGNSVTINATVTNAGSAYSIVWKNNGVTFNTTTVPSVTYTKGAGTDMITAIITVTSPGCYNMDTSSAWTVGDSTVTIVMSHSVTEKGVTVYPNPTNDDIFVKGLELSDKVCISDLLGRKRTKVWEISDNQSIQHFSLSGLEPGTYFLNVWDDAGISKVNIVLQKLSK